MKQENDSSYFQCQEYLKEIEYLDRLRGKVRVEGETIDKDKEKWMEEGARYRIKNVNNADLACGLKSTLSRSQLLP